MAQYSKSFEREENRLMNKGITRSVLSVVLCWLPVASLILAISGFVRVAARITKAHRAKKFFMTLLTLAILIAVLGAHVWAVYVYVRNPNIVNELAHKGWKAVTGEDVLPWETTSADIFDTYNPDEYDVDYDSSYDDPDAAFDDRELAGFEEDLTGVDTPADMSSQTDETGLKSTDSLDLYNQMKSEKGKNNSTPVG